MQIFENLIIYAWLGWIIFEISSGLISIRKDFRSRILFGHLNFKKVRILFGVAFCILSFSAVAAIYFLNHQS